MKQSVINLETFCAELRDSGIPASLDYYEDEEAYVLNVGGPVVNGVCKGKRNLQIAPGFLYERPCGHNSAEREILAYVNRVMVFAPDGNPAKPESADEQVVFDKLDGLLHGECGEIGYSFC